MCDNINLGIPPPLQSKIQYLPFEYLEWDKFENLLMSIDNPRRIKYFY